jgi:transcription elongation GreA/GreB family factor
MSVGAARMVSADVVRLGSRVRVHDDDGECELVIVDADEANASAGRVSSESPLGHALLGCVVGQVARVRAPGGHLAVRIVAIVETRTEVGG